eukprot:3903320-Rhodomonas_salina.3
MSNVCTTCRQRRNWAPAGPSPALLSTRYCRASIHAANLASEALFKRLRGTPTRKAWLRNSD